MTGSQTWGWGFAGISHFFAERPDRGWTYINHATVASYFRALDADTFPVERGFRYTSEADFRLTVLFQMLVSMAVYRGLYTALTDVDEVEEFAEIWEVLTGLGWVRNSQSHVELVGDGVFYTPLIQSLLARDRVLELRRTVFDRSA